MAETATTTATAQAAENTAAEQNTATAQANEGQQNESKSSEIEALIQRAVDRATNKLGNENKKLRSELDAAKKANMDADEVKKFELSEKEKEIAEREQALKDKENRLFAIKAIEEAGLGDGKGASLTIVDFVMADTEAAITEKVKAFDGLVKGLVQAKVDAMFKANGRTPGVGNDAPADTSANSFAVSMGKKTAQINKNAQSVLDHYIGGKN